PDLLLLWTDIIIKVWTKVHEGKREKKNPAYLRRRGFFCLLQCRRAGNALSACRDGCPTYGQRPPERPAWRVRLPPQRYRLCPWLARGSLPHACALRLPWLRQDLRHG